MNNVCILLYIHMLFQFQRCIHSNRFQLQWFQINGSDSPRQSWQSLNLELPIISGEEKFAGDYWIYLFGEKGRESISWFLIIVFDIVLGGEAIPILSSLKQNQICLPFVQVHVLMAEDPGRNIHQNKVKQAPLFCGKHFLFLQWFFWGRHRFLLLFSNGQSMKDWKAWRCFCRDFPTIQQCLCLSCFSETYKDPRIIFCWLRCQIEASWSDLTFWLCEIISWMMSSSCGLVIAMAQSCGAHHLFPGSFWEYTTFQKCLKIMFPGHPEMFTWFWLQVMSHQDAVVKRCCLVVWIFAAWGLMKSWWF